MSALPPGSGGSFEPRDDELYPPSRRRRTLAIGAAVTASAVLAIVVFASARGSGNGPPTLSEGGAETTTTTEPDATTTTSPAEVPTSVAVVSIEIEFGLGSAVIARHISCHREDRLKATSVEAVEAAVAADNDTPDSPGGAPKPYAHDAQAQSEIVRASLLVLRRTKRFYADCRPVPVPRRATTVSDSSSEADSSTLPPSR